MSDTVAAFLDECTEIDALVTDLDDATWARGTPAQGWTIAHQIAHLAWTDEVALMAATRPEAFTAEVEEALQDVLGHVDRRAEEGATTPPSQLLERWRRSRAALAAALREAPEGTNLPWFGPPMSPRSMATARLMEVWAHGQDIAGALGVHRTPTDRLREVCHLGVRTRDFAYVINNLPVPQSPFGIRLTAPDGDTWEWGEAGAVDRVTGTAEDFCLVVTQRRDVDETGLVATGEAVRWLTIAQAFAGPPRGTRS